MSIPRIRRITIRSSIILVLLFVGVITFLRVPLVRADTCPSGATCWTDNLQNNALGVTVGVNGGGNPSGGGSPGSGFNANSATASGAYSSQYAVSQTGKVCCGADTSSAWSQSTIDDRQTGGPFYIPGECPSISGCGFYVPNYGESGETLTLSGGYYLLGYVGADIAYNSAYGYAKGHLEVDLTVFQDTNTEGGTSFFTTTLQSFDENCMNTYTGGSAGVSSCNGVNGVSSASVPFSSDYTFSVPNIFLTSGHYYHAELKFYTSVSSSAANLDHSNAYGCTQWTAYNNNGAIWSCEANYSNDPTPSTTCNTGTQPTAGKCYYTEWKSVTYQLGTPPDFQVSASPTSLSMSAAAPATDTVTVTSASGQYSYATSLSASSNDPYLVTSLSPSSVTPPAGSNAQSTLTLSDTNCVDSGTYSVTITGTASDGTFSTSHQTTLTVTVSPANSSACNPLIADDFSYTSISDMLNHGWTECGGGSSSQYSVGSSVLTLVNNGQYGAAMCHPLPAGSQDWTAGDYVEATSCSGCADSISLVVTTVHHNYRFQADSYNNAYLLLRDNTIVVNHSGYSPQFGVWHSLRLEMRGNLVSMFFDGSQVGSYQEADSGTTLTAISMNSPYYATVGFDYVGAASTTLPFSDDFQYSSINGMLGAGWTQFGGGSANQYSVSNSILSLLNDEHHSAGMAWSHIPSGASNWSVSTKVEWAAGSATYGSIQLEVGTTSHTYRFDGDASNAQWLLLRDSVIVARYNSYSPQLNVWHVLKAVMQSNTLTLYLDGTQMGSYAESTPGTLASVNCEANWGAVDNFDYVTATSP